ncbi:hypothetical protein BELL_0947g00020 [Botrytis elliptica]|uniref:Heterokaryon incompatibility domain-containing protein n=1 Tax=Botrytis elliptica TaxID=278938 RepID=A0A4Z1JBL5_9HELO|nr:hypothetical protein BELL_0947g00020 [Botrytis elliptica]
MDNLYQNYDDLSETDSIRLLILHPGTLGSPIQSDLIHTTLRDCRCDIHGNYTALSYVWGDANDTTYIFVDGFQFAVTVNLAAALHDLRDEKRQLRLWADAICINQTNNLERSQQVGLMKEIYSYAQNTVVYLGDLVERTKCLFELMHQRDPDRSKLLIMADDTLDDIVSRPWFTRVWVYQELVLSNIVFVQVGRMRVSWDYLCEVLLGRYGDPRKQNRAILSTPTLDVCHDKDSETESKTSHSSSMVPTMHEIRHDHDTQSYRLLWNMYEARSNYQNCLRYGGRVISLLEVLVSRRGSKVSDLRDIIYGHLAVADLQLKYTYERKDDTELWPLVRSWTLQDYIPVVDYTKSVEDVFIEAACFTSSFRSIRGLSKILYHADVNASHTRRSNLPSWVPDWTLDENSLQGPPWPFDVTDARLPADWVRLGRKPPRGYQGSELIVDMGPIPAYPHILSFFYNYGVYKLQVVEKVAQIAVVDELKYESARQKLTDSIENILKLTRDPEKLYYEACSNIFQLIYYLWESLEAMDIYPIPSEDLSLPMEVSLISWLSNNIRDAGIHGKFKSPKNPYLEFLLNISIIALKGKASLDMFRGMKFARFRSGRVGVVPTGTERGDFTLTSEWHRGWNSCMFRPKEDPENETYNDGIRANIDTGVDEVIPIQHCTFFGKAWLEDCPSWRMPAGDGNLVDPRARRLKIIAIH